MPIVGPLRAHLADDARRIPVLGYVGARSGFREWGVLWGDLLLIVLRVASDVLIVSGQRLLDVGSSYSEVEDEDEDSHGKDDGGRAVPEPDPADVAGLADVVGEGRPQRTGHDVGHPEGDDTVQTQPPPRQGWQQDDDPEDDPRCEVTEAERGGREVPQRRSEGESGEYGRPIEALTSPSGDAVDGQRSLAAVPHPEDGDQHDGPQQRRTAVGNADVQMEEVRDPGAEDGDGKRQEPVSECPGPASSELQCEPDDEEDDFGSAAANVPPRLQVVRRRLPACRGEDLHHPEQDDDLGDLRSDRLGEETTNHWQAIG